MSELWVNKDDFLGEKIWQSGDQWNRILIQRFREASSDRYKVTIMVWRQWRERNMRMEIDTEVNKYKKQNKAWASGTDGKFSEELSLGFKPTIKFKVHIIER